MPTQLDRAEQEAKLISDVEIRVFGSFAPLVFAAIGVASALGLIGDWTSWWFRSVAPLLVFIFLYWPGLYMANLLIDRATRKSA